MSQCNYDASKRYSQPKTVVRLPSGDEDTLTDSVTNIGPITAGIYARPSIQFYDSGVYYDPTCISSETDLGGLIVGYGSIGDRHYYIFKNSWGTQWVIYIIISTIIY